MKLIKEMIIGFFLLAAILLLEKYTDWDAELQNHFFIRETNFWMIDPALHNKLGIIFYQGLKSITMGCGILCLLYLLASFKISSFRACRKPVLILLLSLIFVPVIVASAKYITNVYCPYQLAMYNGINPFVRILDHYPEGFIQIKPGRCFPAGHATAGFAFMALYFCFNDKRKKILGLSLGIFLGLTAGTYQMLRGQHFLSHTLFSMVASFMVILVIDYIINLKKVTIKTKEFNQ